MLYETVLLRTFAAICDYGSFTRAAREVNLTQSAVSLHIKRLEEQVGSPLIVRNARGVRLTEHGEILLSYARRILALRQEAEHRLRRSRCDVVRIGAPEYFDLRTLSSLTGQFATRYPAVRLEIELGIDPGILEHLDEGELDIAIVSKEIGEGGGIFLCRERRIWAAGKAMKLDPEQPAPLALYPPDFRWRQLALEQLDRAGRPWTVVLQSAGTAGILAALDAGLAITIFPESGLPDTLISLGRAEALPALPDFELVLRRSRKGSPAADPLADMIIDFFHSSTARRPGNGMHCAQRWRSCSRADRDAVYTRHRSRAPGQAADHCSSGLWPILFRRPQMLNPFETATAMITGFRKPARPLGLAAALACCWTVNAAEAPDTPTAPVKIAVFPFELDDYSAAGQKQNAYLAEATEEARQQLLKSGRYRVIDTSDADLGAAKGQGLRNCGGCEAAIAKELGADQALIGVVSKISMTEYLIKLQVRDAESGEVVSNVSTGLRMGADYSWPRGVRRLVQNRMLTTK